MSSRRMRIAATFALAVGLGSFIAAMPRHYQTGWSLVLGVLLYTYWKVINDE